MSSFTMHRFRTIDRPLSRAEMEEIDSWSSRFSPTSIGVTYVYHYGSFKQDVDKVFPKYFDAMLYVSNWGEKQLMFRFPKDLVDWRTLTQFTNIKEYYRHLDFKRVGNYVIMDLYWNEEEGGEWMEEEDYILDTLLPLREEILNGDYRTLYLGWLMVQGAEESEEDEYVDVDDEDWADGEENAGMPPIPANLQRLTTAHQYLIEKFDIDEDIVKAAAETSPNATQQKPDYKQLIALLSNEEKEAFLLRFAIGERRTEVQLKQRLEALSGSKKGLAFGKSPSWESLTKKAKIIENEAAKEYAEVQRVAHINRMESLITQKTRLWQEAENNILKAQGNSYDKATKILYELKEIAAYEKEERKFEQKLGEFISPYIGRGALLRRLRNGGVMGIKG